MMKKIRIITAITLLVCGLAPIMSVKAQRQYEPHFAVGAKGGVTFSQMAFTPGIEQKLVQGITSGYAVRYTEE